MKLSYEDFYGLSATFDKDFLLRFDGYQYTHEVSVHADDIFLYFLFGVLESYELEPCWQFESISFLNVLDFKEQDFEESVGFLCLEKAKEKLNEFFGEGEEREAKFSMLSKNEEIFKNVFGIDYQKEIG